MKTKNLLILFMSLSATGFLHAQQEQVRHTPDLTGHNALIAEWYDTISVSYTEEEKGDYGFFLRGSRTSPTARQIDLPHNMFVNDMDQYVESLVFCGTMDTNNMNYGMIGILNVINAFDWGQPMHFMIFDWRHLNGYNISIRMTKPKKMVLSVDTQSASPYQYIVGLVGDCEIITPTGDTVTRTTICEVDFDYNSWSSWIHYNQYDNIVYKDITATDNHIVAVALNNTNGNMLLQLFDKNSFPFLAYPSNSGYLTEVADGKAEDMILVEALDGDDFATANYYSDGANAGSTVKLFDANGGNPVCSGAFHLVQNTSPVISSSWILHELKYEKPANMLYLLQDMDDPNSPSTISAVNEYDISNISSMTTLTSWVNNLKLHGLCIRKLGGFNTVGTSTSDMTVFKKIGGYYPDFCGLYKEFDYEKKLPQILLIPVNEMSFYYNDVSSPYPFNPITISVTTDCSDE